MHRLRILEVLAKNGADPNASYKRGTEHVTALMAITEAFVEILPYETSKLVAILKNLGARESEPSLLSFRLRSWVGW